MMKGGKKSQGAVDGERVREREEEKEERQQKEKRGIVQNREINRGMMRVPS